MRKALVILAVLAASAAVVLAVEPVRDAMGHALRGDVHALRGELLALGVTGAVVLVALILAHAVVWFPAEIVNAAAGLIYGVAIALPLVMVSWLVSGLIAYWLGAAAGRPLALRLAGEQRVAMAEDIIERGGVPALIVSRLIPFVPYSLMGYVAGAARVPVGRYTWTTFVGILPITTAATYMGHSLEDFSPSDPLMWIAVAILTALVVLSAVSARRLQGRSR